MARSTRRESRAAEKRLIAAVQACALGLGFLLLPYLLGHPMIALMLRPLAPVGWLLFIAGGVMIWYLRRKPSGFSPITLETRFGAPLSPRKRPSRPTPLSERIDPVHGPLFEPEGVTAAEAGRPPAPERVKPTSWGPAGFVAVEWRRFEAVVETLFAQAGFLTKALSHGPDGGVDVWLCSKSQADGKPVSIVQGKHWQGKQVGVAKVRELRGVIAAEGIARGQFATTSTFTPDAVVFAGSCGIKLHDRAGYSGSSPAAQPNSSNS